MAQNPIPYRIIQVHIDAFNMKNEPMEDGSKIGIKSSYTFQTQFEQELIRCISDFSFVKDNEQMLNLQLTCVFAVEHEAYQGMYNDDRSKVIVPAYFCRYMATIAVGAARGAMAAKIQGSELENLVLPPINLVEAIKNDTIFDVQEQPAK